MHTKSDPVKARIPICGLIAVVTPLLGWFVGNAYTHRRHGNESGEASLIHMFELAGVVWIGLGIAGVLVIVAFRRRERYRWLALLGFILDWPIGAYLNQVGFW